jgi:hypothetical protein
VTHVEGRGGTRCTCCGLWNTLNETTCVCGTERTLYDEYDEDDTSFDYVT